MFRMYLGFGRNGKRPENAIPNAPAGFQVGVYVAGVVPAEARCWYRTTAPESSPERRK
jgi:hypothetical protein